MKALPVLVLSIALTGCGTGPRTFQMLGPVTSVTVTGRDGLHPIATVTDGKAISQIVAFVDSHRTGWGTPWYGIPVPVVTVQFYDGAEFKGHFGVGRNFLETQREGGFFSQRVSSAEVRRFLDLVGVNASSVYGEKSGEPRNLTLR
jgi:hypothetical protein